MVKQGMGYATHTVVQLRAMLAEMGLPTSGKKDELIKRLEAANSDSKDQSKSNEATDETKDELEKTTAIKEEKKDLQAKKPSLEGDILKKRAERFGIPPSFQEKLALRKERFGDSTGQTSNTELMEKMKKRKERFGVASSKKFCQQEELEKRKMRCERFGIKA